jgi:hypothetical protein
MAVPEKRQQVMFAKAVNFYVFHNNHFIVADAEHGAVQ